MFIFIKCYVFAYTAQHGYCRFFVNIRESFLKQLHYCNRKTIKNY